MDLERAIEIAAGAHRGQRDKAGEPFILHPLRVMNACSSRPEQIVAVLHDLIEDSDWTLEDLRREGLAEDLLAAVDAMTRREGESYGECPELCVSGPVHAVSDTQASKRSPNIMANWLRAANHSRTFRPSFSKLRMAR